MQLVCCKTSLWHSLIGIIYLPTCLTAALHQICIILCLCTCNTLILCRQNTHALRQWRGGNCAAPDYSSEAPWLLPTIVANLSCTLRYVPYAVGNFLLALVIFAVSNHTSYQSHQFGSYGWFYRTPTRTWFITAKSVRSTRTNNSMYRQNFVTIRGPADCGYTSDLPRC